MKPFSRSSDRERLDYSDRRYWYDNGRAYDAEKIDVFYGLSTTLLRSADENGDPSINAALTTAEREIMDREYAYISAKMFDGDHFNFFAPYYRQLTFEAYEIEGGLASPQFLRGLRIASNDICDAFDYYMGQQNDGRPFILAGFSQGAMMTEVLLSHMTDEQYSRMIAAYAIGFRVTEKDLTHAHIKAAMGADDTGVIISYNSVQSADHIWEAVAANAACCINPLNWKTDETPAELLYDGDKGTVHVDQKTHLLVVEGMDPDKYDGMGYPIERGVYHMWDPRFYAEAIRENAIHRAEMFRKKQ